MNSKKLSIIVSGYNEESHIRKCVDSLLSQTLHEIEIILVDDASTDNTLKMMRNYEATYPEKVKVIHTDVNLRLGGARNLGIEAAQGEYIAFTDCDDWVEQTMYEELYNEALKEKSDICFGLIKKVYENNKQSEQKIIYNLPVGNINVAQRKNIVAKHSTFLQRCIFKRSLFVGNNIRFPANIRYEDVAIDPIIYLYTNNISKVEKPLYNYFIRSNSIMTEKNNKKYLDKLAVSQFFVKEFKERGYYRIESVENISLDKENYYHEINYLYFRKGYIHTAINYLLNTEKIDRKVINNLKNELLKLDPNYRQNTYYKSRKSFIIIDIMLECKPLLPVLRWILKTIKYNV